MTKELCGVILFSIGYLCQVVLTLYHHFAFLNMNQIRDTFLVVLAKKNIYEYEKTISMIDKLGQMSKKTLHNAIVYSCNQ
jgi:diadenosine tetraphosphate (Ap4A) HIT family hydrolase